MAALLAVPAADARGQSTPQARTTAGGDEAKPAGGATRTFAIAAAGGYDEDVLGGSGAPGAAPLAGNYTALHANFAASLQPGPLELTISGSSAGRHFPVLPGRVLMHHALALDVAARLGRRLRISGTQTGHYAPQDLLARLPGTPASGTTAAAAHYDAATRNLITSDSRLALASALTRRSSVAVSYAYRLSQGGRGRMAMDTASAEFAAQAGRSTGIRFIYARHATLDTWSAGTHGALVHDVQAGFEISPGIRRRTRLVFGAGSSLLPRDRQVHAGGNAMWAQAIGRRWQSTLDYRRTIQFLEATGEPTFGDGVTASIDGTLARLQLRVAASYHTGEMLGFVAADDAPALEAYQGTARIGIQLHRRLVPYVEYSRYRHRFTGGLPAGPWPGALNRQRLEAGVAVATLLPSGAR